MSYLSIALQRQTERRDLKQSDIARGAGLSRSYVSRLFSVNRTSSPIRTSPPS